MFKPAALLFTDPHLSEKAEDQYRFDIFPWIVSNYATKLMNVFIPGDLTDRKDRHADWFVNKVVENIALLAQSFNVYIMKGNHCYNVDPGEPFFRFLGGIPNVTYLVEPRRVMVEMTKGKKRSVMFFPHSRHPEKDWGGYEFKGHAAIFLHQTFRGAKSESGFELDGLNPGTFKGLGCPIFSGDVHNPQQLGPITYIGCPWHVHFGDKFKPRVFIADADFVTREAYFPAPQKLVVEIPGPVNLRDSHHHINAGDRVKVRLFLPRSEFVDWPRQRDQIKKICREELKVELHGIELQELKRGRPRLADATGPHGNLVKVRSRRETFDQYCLQRTVDAGDAAIGRELLEA